MSSSQNPTFPSKLTEHLAAERLDAYRSTGDLDTVVLARYLLNMALAESLYPILQFAEVTLRNAIHGALTRRLRRDTWYTDPKAKLTDWQVDQVKKARNSLRRENKKLSAGRMVAELNFGFWTGFFNKAHFRSGIAAYLAREIFCHAPKAARDIKKLDAGWGQVRKLRNRVFHHERIIHWKDLSQQHADILALIGWMDPQLKACVIAMDRFPLIRKAGLDYWLNSAGCIMQAEDSRIESTPSYLIQDACQEYDGDETPFGPRWSSGLTEISPAALTALAQGKFIACDVRDEYVHYLKMKS